MESSCVVEAPLVEDLLWHTVMSGVVFKNFELLFQSLPELFVIRVPS